MIPEPWVGVILALAAYRLARFVGWDDWPPIYRLRAWLIGERWVPVTNVLAVGDEADEVSLPGKTPESEVSDVRPAYDRPLLAHMIHCPFCQGFWVSCAVYVYWLLAPDPVWKYTLAPWALSGAVGLIAKNLDA